MAFQKKTWLARLGQGLNKFIFNGGTKVTLDSSPDVVTQEGTPLSAENMNDLEDRIDDAITSLSYSFLSTSDVEIGSRWKIPRGVFGFKKGSMVYLSFDAEAIQLTSSDTIITLPSEWRPLTEKRCILAMYTRVGSTDPSLYNDYVIVRANGNVQQTITGSFQVGSSLTAIFIYDVSV